MLNHKMVNISTCYLLVVSASFFVHLLATGPIGEGSSGSVQQQPSKDARGFSLSAASAPYVTKKEQQQQQQAAASTSEPQNRPGPSIPTQQHFPHQFTQHLPPLVAQNLLRQASQYFLPAQYLLTQGTQHFPPPQGTQHFPPPRGTQYFHPRQTQNYPHQYRKNLPPRLIKLQQQEQQQYRRRQSVPMDLPAIAAGPSTSVGNGKNSNARVAQTYSMTARTSSGNPANVQGWRVNGENPAYADSRGWRLWNFESPNIKHLDSEQWKKYLHNGQLFPPYLVDVAGLKLKLPGQMAKEISPNKRIGIALFREGIVPFGTHPTCRNGGFFHMSILTSTGKRNSAKLAKVGQIFSSFVSLALQGLPEPLKENVSGIFVRANIHVVQNPSSEYNNENSQDIPCRFVFEFWIRDKRLKNEFLEVLNNGWIKKEIEIRRILLEEFKFKPN